MCSTMALLLRNHSNDVCDVNLIDSKYVDAINCHQQRFYFEFIHSYSGKEKLKIVVPKKTVNFIDKRQIL